MNILYAEEFVKELDRLPLEIQSLFKRQDKVFRRNWRDPRLHLKKLKDHPFPFSFRITRRYRVLFTFVDVDTALFATIGHRKDSYRD